MTHTGREETAPFDLIRRCLRARGAKGGQMIECEWGLDRCSIERCPDRTVLMVCKPLRQRKDPPAVPPHRTAPPRRSALLGAGPHGGQTVCQDADLQPSGEVRDLGVETITRRVLLDPSAWSIMPPCKTAIRKIKTASGFTGWLFAGAHVEVLSLTWPSV